MLGNSPTEIAEQVQQLPRIVKNLLISDWARAQFATFHDRFMARLQETTFDPVSAFYAKLSEKIGLLDDLTKSEHPPTALRALELWINHTIGAPVKRTEVDVKHSLANVSASELRWIAEHRRMPTTEERLMLDSAVNDSTIEGELVEND